MLLMRSQVVDQLEELLKSLRKGYLTIQHGHQSADLSIGDHVRLDFQARSKGEQQSLQITLQWDRQDTQDRLVIGTAPAQRSHYSSDPEGSSSNRRRPAAHPPYEEWKREELYERAKELEIEGRSEMTKVELITALRER
jgi:amphi-Trp domain-containing protein